MSRNETRSSVRTLQRPDAYGKGGNLNHVQNTRQQATRQFVVSDAATFETLAPRQKQRGNFYWVNKAVIEQYGKELGPYGIAVCNVLSLYADNETGESYPKQETIAALTGMSTRSVFNALVKAEALGLVSSKQTHKTDGNKATKRYKLLRIPAAGTTCRRPQAPRTELTNTHTTNTQSTLSPSLRKEDNGAVLPQQTPTREVFVENNITSRVPTQRNGKIPSQESSLTRVGERSLVSSLLASGWLHFCFNSALGAGNGNKANAPTLSARPSHEPPGAAKQQNYCIPSVIPESNALPSRGSATGETQQSSYPRPTDDPRLQRLRASNYLLPNKVGHGTVRRSRHTSKR